MKKIFTPLIHIIFLFPLTAISVGAEMLARDMDILGEYAGVIDMPTFLTFATSVIIIGVPLFWFANILMQRIEKIYKPNIFDFLRQSIFYFILIIYCLISWIKYGFRGNEGDGYLLLWLGISIVAILINYLFLFRNRSANRN